MLDPVSIGHNLVWGGLSLLSVMMMADGAKNIFFGIVGVFTPPEKRGKGAFFSGMMSLLTGGALIYFLLAAMGVPFNWGYYLGHPSSVLTETVPGGIFLLWAVYILTPVSMGLSIVIIGVMIINAKNGEPNYPLPASVAARVLGIVGGIGALLWFLAIWASPAWFHGFLARTGLEAFWPHGVFNSIQVAMGQQPQGGTLNGFGWMANMWQGYTKSPTATFEHVPLPFGIFLFAAVGMVPWVVLGWAEKAIRWWATKLASGTRQKAVHKAAAARAADAVAFPAPKTEAEKKYLALRKQWAKEYVGIHRVNLPYVNARLKAEAKRLKAEDSHKDFTAEELQVVG